MLNTNYRPPSVQAAKDYSDAMYRVLAAFLRPGPLSQCVELRGNTRVTGLNIAQWGVELGTSPKGQRVHAHCFLKFKHTGSMQLSIPKMQQTFLAIWRHENITGITAPQSLAVHIKWIPAHEEMLKKYIYKQQSGPYSFFIFLCCLLCRILSVLTLVLAAHLIALSVLSSSSVTLYWDKGSYTLRQSMSIPPV